MYSQKGDTVLDPFMGLGTTVMASMLSERNSVGFEIDPLLKPLLRGILGSVSVTKANALIHERYQRHLAFVQERIASGKEVKYFNDKINAPVMTAQETDLTLHYLREVLLKDDASNLSFESTYDLETNLAEVPFYEKGTLFG
jgi:hypothetical protein